MKIPTLAVMALISTTPGFAGTKFYFNCKLENTPIDCTAIQSDLQGMSAAIDLTHRPSEALVSIYVRAIALANGETKYVLHFHGKGDLPQFTVVEAKGSRKTLATDIRKSIHPYFLISGIDIAGFSLLSEDWVIDPKNPLVYKKRGQDEIAFLNGKQVISRTGREKWAVAAIAIPGRPEATMVPYFESELMRYIRGRYSLALPGTTAGALVIDFERSFHAYFVWHLDDVTVSSGLILDASLNNLANSTTTGTLVLSW